MAAITPQLVKELRDRTQAGMADCKNALVEADGNTEKAVEIILKKGLAKSAKRAGAVASEGEVRAFVAADAKSGVLVEVNIQTDFAARNEKFRSFVSEVVKVAHGAKSGDNLEDLPYPGTGKKVGEVLGVIEDAAAAVDAVAAVRRPAPEAERRAVVDQAEALRAVDDAERPARRHAEPGVGRQRDRRGDLAAAEAQLGDQARVELAPRERERPGDQVARLGARGPRRGEDGERRGGGEARRTHEHARHARTVARGRAHRRRAGAAGGPRVTSVARLLRSRVAT